MKIVKTSLFGCALVFVTASSAYAESKVIGANVSTGRLGRHVATKMVFNRGFGVTPVAKDVLTLVPDFTKSLRCPGPAVCFIRTHVQVNAVGAPGTAIAMTTSVSGVEVVNQFLGNIGQQATNMSQMAVTQVSPGLHPITIRMMADSNGAGIASYSAE